MPGGSARPATPGEGDAVMSADRCPATCGLGEVRCELPNRHDSPHENNDSGRLTWEPSYVASLRRELGAGAWRWRDLLADVLNDIGEGLASEAIVEAHEALADARREAAT